MEKWLRANKPLFFFALFLIVASLIAIIYTSHSAYQKNFSLMFSPQNITINKAGNTTVESGNLVYHNLSNSTVYVFAVTYAAFGAGFAGLINSSIISTPQNCTAHDYRCLIDVNKIVLPNNQSSYPLSVSIPWSNRSRVVTRVGVVAYNAKYFYIADSLSNSTSQQGMH